MRGKYKELEVRMSRAIWKGSISFGLVNIPVELHTAVRDSRPHFHLLHSKDRSPIKYERVCQKEGEPVDWNEIVKGYEYEKGRFVVMTKEDFQKAALEKSRTIDIMDFVKSEEIDDRYFETSYYLVPAKGGERAYALLREALRQSDRVGISRMILREAQHVAAITIHEDALVLTMMRFAEEIVDLSQFDLPNAKKVGHKELEMAKMLVGSLAGEWSPEKYTDEYRANLMRIIQAKIKGKPADLVAPAEPERAEVVDLMERLRRSLGQAGGRRAEAADRSHPRRKPAKAKASKKEPRRRHKAA